MKRTIPLRSGKDGKRAYDFDAGYLVKSPCRHCEKAGYLPGCMSQCKTLKEVQKLLSLAMSSSYQFSPDDGSPLSCGTDIGKN
jgi:hypothetical protein